MGQSIEDVEEGEISDSGSVEEISEEDFVKMEAATNNNNNNKPRVWTVQDLYKFPVSRNYSSGLYNLAWAQAVQNKSLDEVLDAEKVIIDVSGDDDDDDEGADKVEKNKEEGELEEGEIDLDSEIVVKIEDDEGLKGNNDGVDANQLDNDVRDTIQLDTTDGEENEVERRVNLIREALGTVTMVDAEKSYNAVCSRLHSLLDSLREVVLGNSTPTADALIQLSFTAIQTVNSVFCSMNENQKEQNKDMLSRLLSNVTSQNPPIFSPEQLKEVCYSAQLFSRTIIFGNNKANNIQFTERVNQKDSDASENASHDLTISMDMEFESASVESLHPNDANTFMERLKVGPSSSRGRGVLLPLLDLHKDHDEDSLPSPTQTTPLLMPLNSLLPIGGGAVKPEWPLPHPAEDTVMHPYERDALKAVSSYQQKFGRSSFLMNELPSPTPSEEDDDGDGDTGGEVSSSSMVGSVKTVNPPILAQSAVSSFPHVDSSKALINASSAPNTAASFKSPVKSRDPRLRFAHPDLGLDLNQRLLPMTKNEPKADAVVETATSRKQKPPEEPILDGPALKRQRNGLTDSEVVRDVQTVLGSGGGLEDRGTSGPQFTSSRSQVVENTGGDLWKFESAVTASGAGIILPNLLLNGTETLSGAGGSTPSLQSLLKDIAGNPTIWMNIIKTGQQKSVEPMTGSTHTPSLNSILGAVPSPSVPLSKPPVLGQGSAGLLQTPPTSSMNLQDELGKIRMKPRDPRRILHSNISQKAGSLGPDQAKTNAALVSSSQEMKGNLNLQNQDQADKKSTPPKNPPDITSQFTNNLKNIADILSVSQASIPPPIIPQNTSSQPVQVNSNRMDIKSAVQESVNLQSGTIPLSAEVAAGPSPPQNTWGDVEHLFDGFDDQQKAAIQRERARRIEEQNKMFAAHKLCLVLDLDHTLLNSAKFSEVDPVHDELLRKKEEQDREKPYRHLFRFPHMGMWTKLRPGIWNFLEKASMLFELHLYTMGNKLYATEMAKLLDPKGVLFNGRVISRGDDSDLFDGDERVPKSKDLEGVLGMESSVVIIDDSVRVWPHNKLNLIVVERYIYFPCSRRQFGLLGPSLLEIDHDERPEDGTLSSSLAVIEKIHQNFFSHQSLDEADVRNILASEQRKILGGCRIVFSRVFPVGEANPHLHPLWQTAEQFGAVCTNQIDEQVTHVVANSLGTDKVNWALSTGRFVVHPGWVEASALLYRRANEHDFAIKP
ncbi:hypothetical protein RHMOL_Rhmol12G0106900 [Rhododendron molle]|uniref:Uncharacterized protein n=1 Tax=Rhododendron molle TaxID=49168 RepID=A0ACC0LGY3_RHOML|nr:hypothetical protein RHMOL_Rhmol12G0106900 [Rhododendron molle]